MEKQDLQRLRNYLRMRTHEGLSLFFLRVKMKSLILWEKNGLLLLFFFLRSKLAIFAKFVLKQCI